MAPGRRKCSNKATAAASRRKWKVGDLVLAKVKGFPAWPATVSEPQKWGYPADLKKVLVYFFGTQQIAFCNPADVEEFTEEKKLSLLGRRHGKGSDFARALTEIIDCFEKLKAQDQVTSDNLTEETIITNENNSDESLTKSVNDEAPGVAAQATNNLNSLTEAAVAAAAEDDLHDEARMEEAHSNSGFTETRVYSTRSKTDATQSRNVRTQRRISARRLRSSSRIDTTRLQNVVLPSFTSTRSSRRLGTNALQDRSLRRSRRIMKSSDDSEGHNVNSPAFVSNGSIEENDSEIMTVDSDTLSFNDGSSVDSGCKPVDEEPFNENNEGQAGLSDRLDFQTNASIVKKKRKLNRKRHRNDIVLVAKVDEVVSETDAVMTESVSPSCNEKVAERHAKEDGDEHLPLVKRARVRKGRPSPVGDKEGTLVHEEEKTLEVPEIPVIQSSEPLNCKVDEPAGGESVVIKGDKVDSSFLNASPRKPQYWETRKNFVDGESALPPSKRLHRALEAMSANVAEDSQRVPPTANTHSIGCPSCAECSELSTGSRQVDECCNDGSKTIASEFRVGLSMEERENDGKTSTVASDCGKTSFGVIANLNPHSCQDSSVNGEGADSKCLKVSPLNEHAAETDAENIYVNTDSPNGEEPSHLDNKPCLTISLNCCKFEHSEVKEVAKISDPDISQMNSDSILAEQITSSSLNLERNTSMDSSDGGGGEENEIKNLCLSDNNQDIKRSEFVEEAIPASTDSNVGASATQVKVLKRGLLGNLVHCSSVSNDHLEDKVVSVAQCSSFVAHGADSVPTPSSSKCKLSASDDKSYIEKTSSCSNAQSHLEKAKLAGKSINSVGVLSSFEAIIRSLTRTKESIGRATRIAIDCAKFGFASKVMEILARNLESESSPRKKVDLFFLVDSITQCSGGMKGNAGIYPAAIQALLPRLLLAAAPPSSSFYENHRQCLKVLRVWLERKVLPEPMIRHHIRELDALYSSHVTGGSRRSCRFERPFDDPIRQMEGMLVDEYGSNSSIQLPGFCMPPMLRDDDDVASDSDGESFEAVTPEHNVKNLDEETTLIVTNEKRSHILEDVDVEFEMEDVAPSSEAEFTSTSDITATDSSQMSHNQSDNHYGAPFAPQQPYTNQLVSPPLPRSPPPLPPPPPPLPPPPPPSASPPTMLDSGSNVSDPKFRPSSQESRENQSLLPRVRPRTLDAVRHRSRDSSPCRFSDQPTSHLSGRASNTFQPVDGSLGKGFHLRPPHPAPSNQFSYVQERVQSRRDIPPPSQPNRFHTRNAENGNFYRDRDRDKFPQRDNIGEYWRPPLPSISGPQYHDGSRMAHAPMYSGPPRESALPNNRWNYPPRSMNHRQFNPYPPPSEGPVPVANKGPNFWQPR